jgi:hypothetical protein
MDDEDTWHLAGHRLLGARVATIHELKGKPATTAIGTIVRWLPAGADPVEDPALFHMAHADGDGEDLEEGEMDDALVAYGALDEEEINGALERASQTSAMAKYENTLAKRGMRVNAFGAVGLERLKSDLIDLEDGLRSGLKSAGSAWEGGGSRSERSRWLSKIKRAVEVADLATLAMELEEVVHAVQEVDEGTERPPWRQGGHEYVGKVVRRFFALEKDDEGEGEGEGEGEEDEDEQWLVSDGRIESWLPGDGDDPPLWHMVHHDGDEEDLEEHEAMLGISSANERRTMPNMDERAVIKRLKAEAEAEAKAAAEAAEEESEEEDDDEESEEEEEEEEDDDDDSESGEREDTRGGRRSHSNRHASFTPGTGLSNHARLWRSAEARARWLAAMKAAASCHMLAIGLVALKQHTSTFSPIAERKQSAARRMAEEEALASWYHAGAFASKSSGSKSKAGTGRGGGLGVRFSAQEEKWLLQAYERFAKGGSKTSWCRKALDTYAFHSSRTIASLLQKWKGLQKK